MVQWIDYDMTKIPAGAKQIVVAEMFFCAMVVSMEKCGAGTVEKWWIFCILSGNYGEVN